jgi:exodeoxyribonuclease VII large subunit
MSETPDDASGEHNLPVLSVSELSQALKRAVEDRFSYVRVQGEISGFKRAASGHLYFTLKDADANLDGVCWRGTAGRLGMQPEDGMEIVATGRLTTYAGRSRYQIVVEHMELAGQGALLKLLEERRRMLTAEGLFAEDRKQDLPFIPDVIGVVTSPTGAVIRDILHRIADRFPRRVLVWPVLVQGDGAPEQITAAIEGFNALPTDGPVPRPDLIIVARGGGSLEDLWAFNEEAVVRAAAASTIPLISAVGHETDTTLIDFAADRRAPTPTAAAEMAVPVRLDLLAQVLDDGTRLFSSVNRLIGERRTRIEGLARGLPNLRRLVEDWAQRLDDWSERLGIGLAVGLERRRARVAELAAGLPDPRREIVHAQSRLDGAARPLASSARRLITDARGTLDTLGALLESYSYEGVLKRGFVLINDDAGNLVPTAADTAAGMRVDLRFHDGQVAATIDGSDPDAAPPAKAKRDKPAGKKDDVRQGKLL